MEIFRPDFETRLVAALAQVRDEGAAYIESAFGEDFRRLLSRQLELLPFQEYDLTTNGVRENAERWVIDNPASVSLVEKGIEVLTAAVRRQGGISPGFAEWQPNHFTTQRYRPRHFGVSAHRDLSRSCLLLAIVNVSGRAPFSWLYPSEGRPVREKWAVEPGSLILLRGTGLINCLDERPYHQVDPPRFHQRVVLIVRQESS